MRHNQPPPLIDNFMTVALIIGVSGFRPAGCGPGSALAASAIFAAKEASVGSDPTGTPSGGSEVPGGWHPSLSIHTGLAPHERSKMYHGIGSRMRGAGGISMRVRRPRGEDYRRGLSSPAAANPTLSNDGR